MKNFNQDNFKISENINLKFDDKFTPKEENHTNNDSYEKSFNYEKIKVNISEIKSYHSLILII